MDQHAFAQSQVVTALARKVEQRAVPDLRDAQCPRLSTGAFIDLNAEQLTLRQQLMQRLQVVAGIGAQLNHTVNAPGAAQGLGEQRQIGRHQRLTDVAIDVLVAEIALPEFFLLTQITHCTVSFAAAAGFIRSAGAIARPHDPAAHH